MCPCMDTNDCVCTCLDLMMPFIFCPNSLPTALTCSFSRRHSVSWFLALLVVSVTNQPLLVFAQMKQTRPHVTKKIHSSELKKSLSVCALGGGRGGGMLGGLSLRAVMASFPHRNHRRLKNRQFSRTLLYLLDFHLRL